MLIGWKKAHDVNKSLNFFLLMTKRLEFFWNVMLDTRSNSNVLDHLMLELARYPNFGENHMLELARYPNFLMLAHPY